MKTWLRNRMTNERLTGLALMHINDDVTLDVEQVIDTFARQNPFIDILNDLEDSDTKETAT